MHSNLHAQNHEMTGTCPRDDAVNTAKKKHTLIVGSVKAVAQCLLWLRAISDSTSYSEGPGFRYRPGVRLCRITLFVVFFSVGIAPEIMLRPLPSNILFSSVSLNSVYSPSHRHRK
jgi:hypothetical protein